MTTISSLLKNAWANAGNEASKLQKTSNKETEVDMVQSQESETGCLPSVKSLWDHGTIFEYYHQQIDWSSTNWSLNQQELM